MKEGAESTEPFSFVLSVEEDPKWKALSASTDLDGLPDFAWTLMARIFASQS